MRFVVSTNTDRLIDTIKSVKQFFLRLCLELYNLKTGKWAHPDTAPD
jgi:hypothetical protein